MNNKMPLILRKTITQLLLLKIMIEIWNIKYVLFLKLCDCIFMSLFDSSVILLGRWYIDMIEGAGLMANTTAHQQGANKRFWLLI